ncbi:MULTISPECIES: MBL fold metallo-hydrolase RNA specificity domain-containing protein [Halomonas]|uniref:MBL fold metallo-hydrolase RNA specificity domain-containing protein n=1 Tax=Halomonas TaxID=2745 RepID=UPI001C94305F|nr:MULTISPECIES: MBL fold metallo-hydrolase [Halomonas]MBY6208222.1 MBL fold metallo-hydrolase [Halomonas sp. DP3Y7-2]MBY6229031.1 MBL fold metallo-hydrolase [Halomonas sp. DP3Y7-1]MCA0916986.1 MBL fold metallo-hydrolase [Halomonas denitrificans]
MSDRSTEENRIPSDFPAIVHHGGADGVTGSCHRLQITPHQAILIDCGLFQGSDLKGQSSFERHQIEFSVDDVVALVVTHVHIDHVGRLPYLLAAGFTGPIICTPPSAKLLPLVIEDALKIGFTRDRRLIERFLDRVEMHLEPSPYGVWKSCIDEEQLKVKVRLQNAGHILGSAYVEIDVEDQRASLDNRYVFSGDLGPPDTPLLPDPTPLEKADVLVLESTYGDRRHEGRRTRRAQLKEMIYRAQREGGSVVIPAFSIGRTQELLYEIETLLHDLPGQHEAESPGAEPSETPPIHMVVVDSPLAARFTKVYRELKPWWDSEAKQRLEDGRHPLSFDGLVTIDSHDDHLAMVERLAETTTSAIVIAASGMATGGRVVNYLARLLPDPRHTVLFVGYQADGTPGRDIQRATPGSHVRLEDKKVAVNATIKTISGFSAHADQQDLLNFVRSAKEPVGEVRLVHGSEGARRGLGLLIGEDLRKHVIT